MRIAVEAVVVGYQSWRVITGEKATPDNWTIRDADKVIRGHRDYPVCINVRDPGWLPL